MIEPLPAPDCRLYRVEQVRELEGIAIAERPAAGVELMQAAGKAVWNLLVGTWPQARHIVVVCGGGNNAGDGYVVAGLAVVDGRQVTVLTLQSPTTLKGAAFIVAHRYIEGGGSIRPFNVDVLQQADVIVDAVFGTGLDRDVTGDFLCAINAINLTAKPVLSVDIPSGLNANTGKARGAAVCADATLSFIARKQGLYTGEAAAYRGNLEFSDLGVAQHVLDKETPSSELLKLPSCTRLLPRRSRIAHKGHYGHLLAVGGDYGYAGSILMCAETAARSGAGLVSVGTRTGHAALIPQAIPEVMSTGVTDAAGLSALLQHASVVAIGPGLGKSGWSAAMLARVLECSLPLVIDADGLNLLALEPVRRENWILTPHPGEAARLLDTSVSLIEADRFAAAVAIQKRYGGVTVLKGSGTIIVDHTKRVSVCAAGNPGMASGGMGDVLTGLIAGLICQKLSPADAARTAVCVHASAADIIAAQHGERGMLATDLLPVIRRLVNPT